MEEIKILAKASENNTSQFKNSKHEIEAGHKVSFPSTVIDFDCIIEKSNSSAVRSWIDSNIQ